MIDISDALKIIDDETVLPALAEVAQDAAPVIDLINGRSPLELIILGILFLITGGAGYYTAKKRKGKKNDV